MTSEHWALSMGYVRQKLELRSSMNGRCRARLAPFMARTRRRWPSTSMWLFSDVCRRRIANKPNRSASRVRRSSYEFVGVPSAANPKQRLSREDGTCAGWSSRFNWRQLREFHVAVAGGPRGGAARGRRGECRPSVRPSDGPTRVRGPRSLQAGRAVQESKSFSTIWVIIITDPKNKKKQ